MIEERRIAEIIAEPDETVLRDLPRLLPELDTSQLLDLLTLLEDPEAFRSRLPLRIRLYGAIAQSAPQPELKLIALLRLLRRLGARKDMPDLGEVPESLPDFTEYLSRKAPEILGEEPLATAVSSLAMATRAFRSGDLNEMTASAARGLAALEEIPEWSSPPHAPGVMELAVAETGHELMFIAANAAFRSGNTERARKLAESWSEAIGRWEGLLGPLRRQRYQYFQLVGHLESEVGLSEAALAGYAKALEYAPSEYRKAFLWQSMALEERKLGLVEDSWNHSVAAVDAWLASPFPQAASPWIEWLASRSDTPQKREEIEVLRKRREASGGVETNRVVKAMTTLYRVLADLHDGRDPSELVSTLDKLIDELEAAGSWTNVPLLLATRAVVAGRLDDRDGMDGAIARARRAIEDKLAPESRPPHEFLLESAHALALRDVGEYAEAFDTLFERALEARKEYPGAVGPDEQTALEAVYYLGALAGYDPDTIEKRVRASLAPGN